MKKLPKTIYVRLETYPSEEQDLLAFPTQEEAVDGDGPTVVGEYVLKSTERFVKKLVKQLARSR